MMKINNYTYLAKEKEIKVEWAIQVNKTVSKKHLLLWILMQPRHLAFPEE